VEVASASYRMQVRWRAEAVPAICPDCRRYVQIARDRGQGGRRPRSRARVREIFRACEGSTGSAGGDFAKPRVLCINAKLGGRFAKFAQMQNSFVKPLEPSFYGFFANYQMQN